MPETDGWVARVTVKPFTDSPRVDKTHQLLPVVHTSIQYDTMVRDRFLAEVPALQMFRPFNPSSDTLGTYAQMCKAVAAGEADRKKMNQAYKDSRAQHLASWRQAKEDKLLYFGCNYDNLDKVPAWATLTDHVKQKIADITCQMKRAMCAVCNACVKPYENAMVYDCATEMMTLYLLGAALIKLLELNK